MKRQNWILASRLTNILLLIVIAFFIGFLLTRDVFSWVEIGRLGFGLLFLLGFQYIRAIFPRVFPVILVAAGLILQVLRLFNYWQPRAYPVIDILLLSILLMLLAFIFDQRAENTPGYP